MLFSATLGDHEGGSIRWTSIKESDGSPSSASYSSSSFNLHENDNEVHGMINFEKFENDLYILLVSSFRKIV